jgi:proteasome lid subunit RPN8/RPN11
MTKITGITTDCLHLIMEASRSTHPREFAGLLSAEKGVISEVVILPGTISGSAHAIFQLHMAPVDFSLVGTVHSHPSYSSLASDADIELFRKYGRVHIIIAQPYMEDSWRAYTGQGEEFHLDIINE